MTEESIRVFARVRPCADPPNDFHGVCIDELDPNKLRFDLPQGATSGNTTQAVQHTFTFDHIFWKDSRQEDIFEIVAEPLLNHTLEGYNSTLFAYGQTGSGKTFTITGDGTRQKMGVVPRAIQYVYDTLARDRSSRVEVSISYLEIYNNIAYDLLTQNGGDLMKKLEDLRKVTIAESGKECVFKDLTVAAAPTLEDAHRLFWSGEVVRQKAETVNNKYSSRSHTIFTLYFTKRDATSIMKSKINFVDLAGSEKFQSLSNEVDQRKLEARHINKSLLTLQNVIIGLNQRQKHIPFRDSALTRFLKDSLVGNVKTAMIATLSTKKDHLVETISTCRFGESVASVCTTTRVNQQELPPQEIIARLREEVARLREELGRGGGGGVPSLSGGSVQIPRSRVVTEAEAVELQDKVVAFVEDTTDQLDVYAPAEVQFCFHFMKDLIKRGNSSALRVSQLQQRLDESQRSVQSLVGLLKLRQRGEFTMSKEAAFLEFYNSHEKCGVAQGLKQSLKECIGRAKTLNEAGTELRQKRDELQTQMDFVEEDIDNIQGKLESCTDDGEREQYERDLEELKERHAQLSPDLEKAISDCARNTDDLNFCKEEIVALNREYGHAKQIIEQDFEKFWMNTVMKHSQQPKTPSTPRPTSRKIYSTTGGSASKRQKP